MQNATYNLAIFQGLRRHGFAAQPLLLRDGEDVASRMYDDDLTALRVQALVRSGDYLMTVATDLDRISQDMSDGSQLQSAELERLFKELLYVHEHFELVPKHSRPE